ncbi:GIY-YIG nuclease family protein [Dendronalium sp. ChiSLP03b]|uniref:GIY-YIG nuclease family protein n=1 Tax=Dendronalium sp. ChiSLP03b TaxID=3075381 RepID=UPI0039196B18
MTYYRTYLQRTDRSPHQPGYCYLIEAVGFHGLIPGCYVRRCKIGLTQDINRRLAKLSLNQPPCNYRVILLIQVEDMAEVENLLHNRFNHCRVKLEKSREYFDLNPIDYTYCLWLFRRMSGVSMWKYINFRNVVATALMVAGIATLAVPVIQKQLQPKAESSPETIPQTRIINRSQLR